MIFIRKSQSLAEDLLMIPCGSGSALIVIGAERARNKNGFKLMMILGVFMNHVGN
jgi:hypothetical protein